ncbi:MAG: transcriptional repressor NrdR [Verrucomicrobia bacterium]|nr:transcriptional repressor NrdR [Verrucomicrobiota bacterium]
MRCPKCGCQDDKVIDSRGSREGSTIRRRRECSECGHRFTTYEEVELENLVVIKSDGRREAFSKEKLLAGVKRACQKRPVSEEAIEELVAKVIRDLNDRFEREVSGRIVGERVMEGLRELDKVAYVRVASVYRRFEEVTDFLQVVRKLEETKNDSATFRLPGF